MGTRDEYLRFYAQVEGEEKVAAMGDAFDLVGQAAAEADPKAQGLIDDIERLSRTQKAIAGLSGLKGTVQETGDSLFLARRRLAELEQECNNTLQPTAKLTKDLARARGEVARLAVDFNRQTAAIARAENVIKGAGYELNQLARAEADVRDKTVQASAAAREYAADLARTGKQARVTGGSLQGLRSLVTGILAGLSVRGAAEGVKSIAMLGDQAELTRNQFTQLYGTQAAGERALSALTRFANANGQAIDQIQQRAVDLKKFGIDPLNGSLQALVDENAAMGGSQERLEGTIAAVGQAWSKQKLQGEEILQLIERGVPVWDLLAKVTGKNSSELDKLASSGQLGRSVISGLLKEIGRMNSGAAAKNAGTLSGLFTQLSGRVRQFFTDVSNKGPLDFFKGQLRDAITLVDRLASSNELEAWARKIGGAIVSVSQSLISTGKFLVQHVAIVLLLAKAYAAVKLGGFLAELAAVSVGAAKAGKGITSLAGALRLLPGGVQIAIALVGIDLAVKGAKDLGDAVSRNLPVTKAWEDRTRGLIEETRASAEQYRAATAQLDQYRNVQTKSAEAVAVLTAQERARYGEGLAGLQRYLDAQVTYYNALRGIGGLNDEGLAHLASLKARLSEVNAAVQALSASSVVADDSLRAKLSEGARILAKDLDAAGNSAKGVGEKLEKALSSVSTDSVQKVGDIGLAIAVIAKESEASRRALQDGLAATLRQMTGEDLLKFQAASVAAFGDFKGGAVDTAAVLDATLLVSLEKLGVAPERFALGMTEAGKQAVAVFQAIIENARATSAQIEAAFTAAIKAASSKEDVEALGAALKAAADQGRISMEGAERAGLALQNRIREITTAADPLGDSFARLGIKSQQALNAARDSAREAFEAIVKGAQRGEASQEDVTRAFEAYAATARAAVAQSTEAARVQVDAQLRAQAAAVGVKDALVAAGDAGADAGARTAAGADQAADSLANLAGVADSVANSTANLGANSNQAAAGLQNLTTAGQGVEEMALDVSAAFADAAANIQGLDRIAFNLLTEQQQRFNEELEAVRASNAALDERAGILAQLRTQYTYLGDAQLQVLANEKLQQQQVDQRRREEDKRKREEQQSQSQGSGGSSGSSGGKSRGAPVVNVYGNVYGITNLVDVLQKELKRREGLGG